jgi:tetratricopeptide (TPR) repeat protein
LLRNNKQKDSALFFFNYAYRLSPSDYRNAAGLAEMMIQNKSYATADSILDAGLNQDSVNVTLLKLRVRSAYEAKDYQHARIPGERLMRLDESPINALTSLALSYYSLKMYADCIRVCDYMLFKEIDEEAIYYYEAKALAKLKDYSKSNDFLETCISKSISKNVELYYSDLGDNYESLHQYSKAIRQYDTAYFLSGDALMNYNIGRVYESSVKNNTLAQKYYAKYLSGANPKTPEEKKAYDYVKEIWGKKNAAVKKNR